MGGGHDPPHPITATAGVGQSVGVPIGRVGGDACAHIIGPHWG